MKKVLIITTVSGFLPQFEKNNVKLLREAGCEIHYASNFKNPIYDFNKADLKAQGIRLHQLDIAKNPLKLRANLRAVKQLLHIMNENDIDIIHCHNPMGGVTGRAAAGLCRKKPYVIYTAHGFHFYKGAPEKNWLLFYPVEWLLARLTDIIVTINREDYERARKLPVRGGENVFQIHGVGVDPVRFAPRKEIARAKRMDLEIPADAFHIVTAAELNDNKNQKVIIEAISALPEKDIYYSICGKGPGEKYLRKLIKEKGLENRVRLLGFRTDMEEILQTADCFAFPSYREGLGIAAVEALLCGVVLVAADNRGTREYAVNGKNAFVCKADDTAKFAKAIGTLYRDEELRAGMSQNCRTSAMGFTIEEVEKTMKEIYYKALNA
ncbi:MAG: glycosyltransferase family 4 protein [Blautia sp.]|nr:glycosyltransferase family 4 protein [Blautia sp.]MCM1201369.1 glycosyltransferase family 4 protein [Bacteroides fragilis]